jgi:SSS family solute:Na+ symporter
VFWLIFDMMTLTVGLYARAALPVLEQPVMAYPLIAEALLPPVAKGFFFVGLLATMMSTLNTLMFVSGTTIGRDLWGRLRRTEHGGRSREEEERAERRRVQAGMVVSCILAIVLAMAIPSVIKLWYAIGTTLVPGLLVPLVTSYFDGLRADAKTAFRSMLAGWLTSLLWLLAGWQQQYGSADLYPFGIEPMFPGLLMSVLVWLWGVRIGKRKTEK